MTQSYVGILHMTHDLWLTEWFRLHGYLIDDSLVSSVHMLGYGDNYFLQDDSLLQSWYCQRMEGTAWRPYTATIVLT